jgi:tryptophanyl-tRNA synthetase
MESNMIKPVILTGLRANNDLHIGNYFGALLPLIDMAKKRAGEYQINLFMPDLHSFTTPIDHSTLQANIINALRIFVAAGLPLDNPDVYIYRQSYVPAHSELTVILNSFTGFGEMERMTQYKDKSAKLGAERVSVGLFDYPVLMACDILLYGAKYVPVGDDQSQHIEITRDLGQRMNNKFGELFELPDEVKKQHEFFGKDQGLRIKDLVDPTKKMSKSDESGKGIIFLGDDPKTAAKKIMSATTDSVGEIHYDIEKQPGITNLLQILALFTGRDLKDVIAQYEGQTSYGELKKAVSRATEEFLVQFQSAFESVDMNLLEAKLKDSEEQMNLVANETLLRVQKAVGLR